MVLGDPNDALLALQLASAVLGSFAAVWALTQKTTYDDVGGNKRLTLSGGFSIALVVVSLLVGATTLGFQTLIKRDEKLRGIEADRQAAIERRQTKVEQQNRDALSMANAATQRLLTIEFADAERVRDFRLAAEASLAASLNLAKANRILVDVGRTLQPLENPSLYVVWDYPGPLRVSKGLSDRIAAAAATADDFAAQERLEQQLGPFSVSHRLGATFIRARNNGLIPRREDSNDLNLMAVTGLTIAVFKRANAAIIMRTLSENAPEVSAAYIADRADYAFTVSPPIASTEFEYELPAGRVSVSFTESPAPEAIRKQGAIVSVPDLEDAILVATPTQFAGEQALQTRRRLALNNLGLSISGRIYRFAGGEILRFETENGEPVFVVPRIGGRR